MMSIYRDYYGIDLAESGPDKTVEHYVKFKKTHEQHIARHKYLHKMLMEIVNDFMTETQEQHGRSTVTDLMRWSSDQTINPSDRLGRFDPSNAELNRAASVGFE